MVDARFQLGRTNHHAQVDNFILWSTLWYGTFSTVRFFWIECGNPILSRNGPSSK